MPKFSVPIYLRMYSVCKIINNEFVIDIHKQNKQTKIIVLIEGIISEFCIKIRKNIANNTNNKLNKISNIYFLWKLFLLINLRINVAIKIVNIPSKEKVEDIYATNELKTLLFSIKLATGKKINNLLT